jgi:AAA15 family ATPase/GTPase
MIKRIQIKNFRSIIGSISDQPLDLGKITVLTGANNSGKSSILYGLMTLHDFVYNPNQSLEELFAFPFINLGGFEDVKNKNINEESIFLGIIVQHNDVHNSLVYYRLELSNGRTSIHLQSANFAPQITFHANLNIGLPYAANQEVESSAEFYETRKKIDFKWNGIQAKFLPGTGLSQESIDLTFLLHSPIIALIQTDFIPNSRGFTKPYYNLVPMTGIVNSEEEIATYLKSEKSEKQVDTLGRVNHYLKEIAERVLELPTNGAPGLFSLLAKNTKTGQTNFLVNEGSGTNQLVTILAKIFQTGRKFICIDEPEVHLHPSMVRKLSSAFVDIVNSDSDRQFLVSTHSEHFVQALLEKVAQGEIHEDDVKIYHLTMGDKGTQIELQKVNSKGQIEGGLSHFYEAELSGLKNIFKLTD